jgi:hypothetical protein
LLAADCQVRQDSLVVDDFNRRYDELVHALVETVALLRQQGVDGWADWLDLGRVRIQRGDGYGLDHVLGAFGGMGSLNDVVIHPANGNPIAAEDVDRVNRRLGELHTRIYTGATWVRRHFDRETGDTQGSA